jgi:hypothetical protein
MNRFSYDMSIVATLGRRTRLLISERASVTLVNAVTGEVGKGRLCP